MRKQSLKKDHKCEPKQGAADVSHCQSFCKLKNAGPEANYYTNFVAQKLSASNYQTNAHEHIWMAYECSEQVNVNVTLV